MSSLRELVFPIYGPDVVRFAVLGGIKFFVIFALTLTRDLKDTIVVTSCGAEAITTLKFFGVLPCSALFFVFYARFSGWVPPALLWYVTAAPFFAYFVAFGFVLYPLRALVHPTALPSALKALLGPSGEALYLNWSFAIYYVVAELYSSVSMGLLFWQFANDVVPIDKSRIMYPLFGQVSSLAPIAAGFFVDRYAAAEDMDTSMRRVAAAVGLCGVGMSALHYIYCTRLRTLAVGEVRRKKEKKKDMSFLESLRFLSQSAYLGCMAVMVLAYGVSIQFSDIMWKSMVLRLHPEPIEYQRYFAAFSSRVGVTTFLVIFVGSNLIKRVGWRAGAVASPLMMGLLAAPFFGLVLYSREAGTPLNGNLLNLAVFFGALQGMVAKAFKSAFFDPTTQMAYIPLDAESKVTGKAAIDVMGSRLGKSGCALLQQMLVLVFGNITDAAHVIFVLFYAVIFGWLAAAFRLSVLFEAAKLEQDKVVD